MNAKDMKIMLDVFEQKIFELEEEKEKYGGYAKILEAQIDIINELIVDVKERFKYKT